MGFRNSILAGASKLIRAAIQSPNYVPGDAGWTVNRDGTAEFSDATIRGSITASTIVLSGTNGEILVYKDTPALGNLIFAVAGEPGVDQFGNPFDQGVSFGVQDNGTGQITFLSNKNNVPPGFNYLEDSVPGSLLIAGAGRGGNNVSYETTFEALSPSLYWQLAESSGTVAADSSGNLHNGTYVGSPTLGVAGLLTDDPATAVKLNGTSQYVTLAGSAWMDNANYSVVILFKGTSANNSVLVCRDGATTPTKVFDIQVESTGGLLQFNIYDAGGSGHSFRSPTAVNDGQPHIGICKCIGGVLTMYLDGLPVATLTPGGTINRSTTASFDVGRRGNNTLFSDYTVAQVGYLPGVDITDAQALALFEAMTDPNVQGPAELALIINSIGETEARLVAGNGVRLGSNVSTLLEMVQRSTVSVPFAAVASATVVVNFPSAFSAIPTTVMHAVQVGGNFDILSNLQAISATQATFRLFQKDGLSITATPILHWEARL